MPTAWSDLDWAQDRGARSVIEGNWMIKPSEQTVPTLVPDALDSGKLMAMAMTST